VAIRIVRAETGLQEAAEILREGGIVAFPTETVYGLGANALNPEAVARIYTAKGRPSTNPIIVHVADIASARALASEWSDTAESLATRFWPGPLTLVVPKAASVADIVTAGGSTVGIRIPNHPIALQLLQQAGVPLAAPSANRSEEVSPTTAQHVADSLGGYIDHLLILDGGPCSVGIESTVIDVTGTVPLVLRPGMAMIAEAEAIRNRPTANPETHRSPGQMARHYAPTTPLVLVQPSDLPGSIRQGSAVLLFGDCRRREASWQNILRLAHSYISMPESPQEYAALLYAAFRQIDQQGEAVTDIVLELPPDDPEWTAIHDRLHRAATKKGTQE
jgi:L-threonylcarbamoyladenylate synthase